MAITKWTGSWNLATADAAYNLIVAAAANPAAKAEIDQINKLARSGNLGAAYAKRMFDGVAQFVLRGLGTPSQVAAHSAQFGVDLATEVRARTQAVANARIAQRTAAQTAVQRTMDARRQGEARNQVRRDEQAAAQAQIDGLKRELEHRDIDAAHREELEQQAAQYEQQLLALKLQATATAAAAAAVQAQPTQPAPAIETVRTPGRTAEGPDGSDNPGAPGDTEFSG